MQNRAHHSGVSPPRLPTRPPWQPPPLTTSQARIPPLASRRLVASHARRIGAANQSCQPFQACSPCPRCRVVCVLYGLGGGAARGRMLQRRKELDDAAEEESGTAKGGGQKGGYAAAVTAATLYKPLDALSSFRCLILTCRTTLHHPIVHPRPLQLHQGDQLCFTPSPPPPCKRSLQACSPYQTTRRFTSHLATAGGGGECLRKAKAAELQERSFRSSLCCAQSEQTASVRTSQRWNRRSARRKQQLQPRQHRRLP